MAFQLNNFRRLSHNETVENSGTSAADLVQVFGVIGLVGLALCLLVQLFKKRQTSQSGQWFDFIALKTKHRRLRCLH